MAYTIMGIDAAFANTGLAHMEVADDGTMTVLDLHIIQTDAVKKRPKGVPRSHDDLRRAREMQNTIQEKMRIWHPDYIVAEVPFGSQSARASWALGIALGVLSSVPNLIEVTPRQVKAASGEKDADKDWMIEWAMDRHPEAPWRVRKLKGSLIQVASVNEHLADAVGACYAALPEVKSRRVAGYNQ